MNPASDPARKLAPLRWPLSARPVDENGSPMTGQGFPAQLDVTLTWDYSPANQQMLALYEQGKRAQWNATTDIDWTIDVDWGRPLDDAASSVHARDEFERSVPGHHGADLWNAFQWEFQSWMVSQFLHGEQGALMASARLAEAMPDVEAKFYAVNQAADEARHVEVFSRYLAEHVPEPYPVADALAALLTEILSDARWDFVAIGMQIIVEPLAMAAFRLANSTFHDRLITSITDLVIRDEARHISFGVLALQEAYRDITAAERRERETFVLDAAALVHRRFQMREVWERLGVDPEGGVEFAQTNPMMVSYRQTLFSRVIGTLNRIGLMTPTVAEGLDSFGLMGRSARLAMAGDTPA